MCAYAQVSIPMHKVGRLIWGAVVMNASSLEQGTVTHDHVMVDFYLSSWHSPLVLLMSEIHTAYGEIVNMPPGMPHHS